MSTVYIDEAAGSDTTGKGTEDLPYQTLGFALFSAPSADAKFLIRKDASVPYDEPTQSSLKKAKKTADGLEKKRKKQGEQAERDAEEKAKKDKMLEESKKVVLVEDASLPKAAKVRAMSFLSFDHNQTYFILRQRLVN